MSWLALGKHLMRHNQSIQGWQYLLVQSGYAMGLCLFLATFYQLVDI